MQKWLVLLVLVSVFALAAGCADEKSSDQQPAPVQTPVVQQTTAKSTPVPVTTATPTATLPPDEEVTVTISDNTFRPEKVTIRVGSQVRWVNADDHPHRVSFATGGFTAFLLGSGQSSSQKFARPGVYDYTCLIYPSMHGTVTVVE